MIKSILETEVMSVCLKDTFTKSLKDYFYNYVEKIDNKNLCNDPYYLVFNNGNLNLITLEFEKNKN
ncbi:hypothetical protein GVAV_003244 [Gurleya vavrai]